jgi:hypothetical protein
MAKYKLDATTIEGIVRDALETSIGAPDSDVGLLRQRNLEYYNGEAVGDLAPPEIADRSDFVATTARETVEGMLPQFMDMFVSSDDVVEFESKTMEGEGEATLARKYVNHLFYSQNDGVSILYDAIKDALIQKTGFIKVWAEDVKEDAKQRYEGQNEEALMMLMQDGWELAEEPEQDEKGLSFTVVKNSSRMAVKVGVCAPHSMRVDGNSRWDAEPAMIGEVLYRRRFELQQDGYVVDDAGATTPESEFESLLMLGEARYGDSDSPHKSHDLIKLSECYIKLDADGDGVAEWLKVCLVDDKLAEYEDGSDAIEQVDGHPYVWLNTIPRPHAFFGDCPVDFCIEPQKLKTHTVRAIQDNMFLTVNQRTYVNELADVNVPDLLENRPGGIVRGRGAPGEAIMPIVQPSLGAPAYQFNEFIDDWAQNSTGFTRYSQGTDANSLNKTATGVSIITQKADMRMKLMARFIGVALKQVFAKMLKLAITYQNQDEMVLINGEYIQINPSHFRNDYNLKIKVGLGTGTKEQQVGRIMAMMQAMQAGAAMGVVGPEQVAEAIKLLAEANEFKSPERFVKAPEAPQGPSPEQIQQGMEQLQAQGQQIQEMGGELQRLEQENAQLKQANANKEGDLQIKAQGGQVDAQFKAQELALKERELALKEQEAMFKAQLEQYNAETQRLSAMNSPESAQDGSEARESEKGDTSTAALIAGFQAMLQPKTSIGSLTRMPDGSYQMVKQENINPQGL